jgi:diacylglycerol kinase family enzyme
MRSTKEARRIRLAAVLAILLLIVVVIISIWSFNEDLRRLSIQVPFFLLGLAGAWYAVTRRGTRRLIGAVVAVVGLVAVVLCFLVQDASTLAVIAGRVVLLVAAGLLGRYAVREAWAARDADAPPTATAPAPARAPAAARSARPRGRPALVINLRSGGGKAERAHLAEACEARGIEPIVLRPGDDLLALAHRAVDGGAPAIGMAGGDGSQALVATVAAERQVPMVVVPAGTRNHLARDLGIDRNDVVGALDAYTDGVERCMDLAQVGDRVFVNNVSLGLYAAIVRSPEYRDAKVDTALGALPKLLGPGSTPFDLRFTGPDGRRHERAHVVQISNNPYGQGADALGRRPRLDTGQLAVISLELENDRAAAAFLAAVAGGHPERYGGFSAWTTEAFEVDSGGPIDAGVDGETLSLRPPLRFTIRPGALPLLLPRTAAGASASSAPRVTLKQVGRIATGRPLTVDRPAATD